jgi:hypothetical protein
LCIELGSWEVSWPKVLLHLSSVQSSVALADCVSFSSTLNVESSFLFILIDLCLYVGILVSYISESDFWENLGKLSKLKKYCSCFVIISAETKLISQSAIDGGRRETDLSEYRQLMEEEGRCALSFMSWNLLCSRKLWVNFGASSFTLCLV